MTYTVVWINSALDELAELWNTAEDRQDVTNAANRIDASLRSHPYLHSESQEQDLRIQFVPPLAVLFEVSDADRKVVVRAVWRPM
jgi:hypothetical protein